MKRERGSEIHVYTDGACQGNHRKSGAIAGVGAWFGKDDERNVSEPLCGRVQTNNRAELTGLIRAIEVFFQDDLTITRSVAEKQPTNTLVCHTDSQYCKNGIESWIKNWKKNGWKTANKKPVKNKDLWMRLDELSDKYAVRYEWVKGHSGDPGNEAADTLAVAGCSK